MPSRQTVRHARDWLSSEDDFTKNNLLVKCTERYAGGYTDTGAWGASDKDRELIYHGENFEPVAVAPFIGYVERDGMKVPKFGTPKAIERNLTTQIKTEDGDVLYRR